MKLKLNKSRSSICTECTECALLVCNHDRLPLLTMYPRMNMMAQHRPGSEAFSHTTSHLAE